MAIVLVLMMLSVSAMADMSAMVFSSRMKIYLTPSTASRQIGVLPRGTQLVMEDISNGWARVNYQGNIGFAKVSDMLSLTPIKGKTNRPSVIMFITPNNMTPQPGTLDRNTTVYVRSINGDLAMISDRNMTILAIIPLANVTV